jgi:hypothetical protein
MLERQKLFYLSHNSVVSRSNIIAQSIKEFRNIFLVHFLGYITQYHSSYSKSSGISQVFLGSHFLGYFCHCHTPARKKIIGYHPHFDFWLIQRHSNSTPSTPLQHYFVQDQRSFWITYLSNRFGYTNTFLVANRIASYRLPF